MNLLKEYDIDISKLPLGQHPFQFKIGNEFFALFDYSLVEEGSLTADLLLEKKPTFISIQFTIKGTVKLICDRSLDSYDHQLETTSELMLKYGDDNEVVSDEIEIIAYNTQKINIANYLYEFVSVAIPMKKLHPRFQDEEDDNQYIFSSQDEQDAEPESDPRWNELKKLKNNK